MPNLIIFIFLCFSLSSCTNIKSKSEIETVVVSKSGSSRATAYELSNKLIPTRDGLIASYLNYDGASDTHVVVIVKMDESFKEIKRIELGDGGDNHGGATIVIDSFGDVHAFYGAHNNGLKYRYSMDNGELNTWSDEIEIEGGFTYPSAVITPEDNIFVIVRDGYNVLQENPWSYDLLTFNKGKYLNRNKILVSRKHDEDFVNRYIHYFAQLGYSNGRLSLAYLLHERSTDDPVIPANGLGYGIGLIHSDDAGLSWHNWNSEGVSVPASTADISLLDGELDAKLVQNDFRSLSFIYDNDMAVLLAGKYSIDEKKWSTTLFGLNDDSPLEKVVELNEPIYKSSLTSCGEGYVVVSEYLPSNGLSVEEGWANTETEISISHVFDGGEYFISKPAELKFVDGQPHWYPSTVKQLSNNYFIYFMFMVGARDGEVSVILNRMKCS